MSVCLRGALWDSLDVSWRLFMDLGERVSWASGLTLLSDVSAASWVDTAVGAALGGPLVVGTLAYAASPSG